MVAEADSRHRQLLQLGLAGVRAALPPALQTTADAWGATSSSAGAFLQAATELTLAERCARPAPVRAEPPPAAAPLETLKAPNAELLQVLLQRYADSNPFLHRQRADLLAARGEHWPFAHLPSWLDYVLTQPESEWPMLLRSAGARGAWLAAQHPTWQALYAPDDDRADIWQTGAPPQRQRWFQQQRQRDAAVAREALSSTWASETSEMRAALLTLLTPELGPDDEPLLETARLDRRKEVRTVALTLLARLPDSAFARRQFDRLKSWLSFRLGALLRAPQLLLTLPDHYDASWSEDGLSEKSSRRALNIGDKANWLIDTLSHVSLPKLLTQLGMDAAQWAKLIAKHEFVDALQLASVECLERQPDAATIAALQSLPMPLAQRLLSAALQAVRSGGDLDRWLGSLNPPLLDLPALLPQLPVLNAAWSQRVMRALPPALENNQPALLGRALLAAAERFDPSQLDALIKFCDAPANLPATAKAAAEAMAIADLRLKLHRFHPEATSP